MQVDNLLEMCYNDNITTSNDIGDFMRTCLDCSLKFVLEKGKEYHVSIFEKKSKKNRLADV